MRYVLDNVDFCPYFCNLQITQRCNLHCLHCGFSSGKKDENELTLDEITSLIADLSALHCERIQLTGGEPLLREDWPIIANRISSSGIEVTLLSNGQLISSEIARRISDSGINTIGISIDGSEASHDKIRNQAGSYEKALSALDNLYKNNVSTGVITTVNRDNINDLEELHEVLIEHNVLSWRLQIPSLMGRMESQSHLMVTGKDIERISVFIVNSRNDHRIKVIPGDAIGYFGPHEKTIRDVGGDLPYFTGCYAGCLSVAIESNGNVKGCLALPPELCEGNVREASLESIWLSKDAFSYNRKFDISMLDGFCRTCEFGEICRAGCKSCAYGGTGQLHNNPFCDYRANVKGDISWWEKNNGSGI